jgi:hypothetical protein
VTAPVAISTPTPTTRAVTIAPETPPSPTPSPLPAGAACAPGVDLLGVSDALDKTRFAETAVGGLSALAPDLTADVVLALVDNERDTPARFYTLHVAHDNGTLGAPRVLVVTVLRDAAGQPFTGRRFDGEGMARTATGELLIASETEPALRRFAPDGRFVADLPVPPRFQVAPRGDALANATFEGLALTPDGRALFAAMEGPLAPDGWTVTGRARLRLLRYDPHPQHGFAPAAQFFYLAEPGQAISDLAALSEHDLLVVERGFVPGRGNTVRLFRVALATARDVADQTTLAAPDLTPVEKALVVDLAGCPAGGVRHPGPQPNPLLDNYEGMALGPTLPDGRRVLLLVSDDNFGADQVTRLLALAIRP